MPFFIVRNDIAKMDTDIVVNAANAQLQLGGGVAGAIAAAAGRSELQAACDAIGGCPTGSAVATPGFGLAASHIIHAVGPIWQGGNTGEAELLRSCYDRSLALASQMEARSIAFPLISAGTFGFPAEEAFEIAARAITSFLEAHEMDIYLVLYGSRETFLGRKLQRDLQEFIDDVYVEEHPNIRSRLLDEESWFSPTEDMAEPVHLVEHAATPESFQEKKTADKRRSGGPMHPTAPRRAAAPFAAAAPAPLPSHAPTAAAQAPAPDELSTWLEHLDASFSSTLLQLIDHKDMTDTEVYKRANISRQLFSKIRGDAFYKPTKKTALALAVGLRLTLGETDDLLGRAGFTLTHSSMADCIVEFFISREVYDIITINQALYAYDQPLLGS